MEHLAPTAVFVPHFGFFFTYFEPPPISIHSDDEWPIFPSSLSVLLARKQRQGGRGELGHNMLWWLGREHWAIGVFPTIIYIIKYLPILPSLLGICFHCGPLAFFIYSM
jgi:hypothetical protein